MARFAKNWVTNPSFETNTTGWTIASGTSSRVTDASFSGAYALELVDTGTDGVTLQLTDWIPVAAEQGVYASIHALSRQANGAVNLQVELRDGFGSTTSSAHDDAPIGIVGQGYDWTTVQDTITAGGGDIECRIWAIFKTTTGAAIGDKWLVDAIELRIDTPLDAFFDGDTPGASWDGTAHASTSTRAESALTFAQDHNDDDLEVAYRFWSVDDNLHDMIELTDWIDGGSVKTNVKDDIKRTASFDCKDLNQVVPFVTRIKVYMERWIRNIQIETVPLGVFSIEMPDGNVDYEHRYGTIDANDISVELADSARGKQFVFNKGKNIIDQAEVRVRDGRGMKVNFPANSKTFSKTEKFPPWMGDIEMLNKLMEMINFQGVYGDGNGIITTQKIKKLSQMQPVLTIRQHEIMSINETNNVEQLCNVVKVYKDNADKAPIFAIARNDDAADPVSTANMRYKALVLTDSEVDTYSEALELAETKLEEGRSFDKTLELEIAPNPYLGIGNVVDVTFDMKDGTCYCGRYWVREWEIPLGPPFWMKVKVNRVQKFHAGFPEA